MECYNIVFGLCHLDVKENFEFSEVSSTRANHSHKLYLNSTRLNSFKNSFFIRVIGEWNSLLRNTVEAGSLELLKIRLRSFLKL